MTFLAMVSIELRQDLSGVPQLPIDMSIINMTLEVEADKHKYEYGAFNRPCKLQY
jgi:hypothetical protein